MSQTIANARWLADALLPSLMLVAIRIGPTAWLFTRMEARFEKVNTILKEIVDRLPAKSPHIQEEMTAP